MTGLQIHEKIAESVGVVYKVNCIWYEFFFFSVFDERDKGTWRGTTVAVKMQRMTSIDLEMYSTNTSSGQFNDFAGHSRCGVLADLLQHLVSIRPFSRTINLLDCSKIE